MPERIYGEVAEKAVRAAAHAVWVQWATLGSMASAAKRATSIIDPEALTLFSLMLRSHERRLAEIISWWAVSGAATLSVQRIRNMSRNLPAEVRQGLVEFADAAIRGGDLRWRSISKARKKAGAEIPSTDAPDLRLDRPPALMLRLRLGIGVGVKADALTYLLASQGEWQSVKSIATATVYSPRAVKRAVDEMAAAGLLKASASQPAEYRADITTWGRLLHIKPPVPRWRFWNSALELLTAIVEWDSRTSGATRYVRSSMARDVAETHREAFRLNRIGVPDPSFVQEDDYLEQFEQSVLSFAGWLGEIA